jgi:hypothetical protein
MACRIATTHTTRAGRLIGTALVSASIGVGAAWAQSPPPATTLSKSCQAGASATTDESPLPNVAAALKQQRKTL